MAGACGAAALCNTSLRGNRRSCLGRGNPEDRLARGALAVLAGGTDRHAQLLQTFWAGEHHRRIGNRTHRKPFIAGGYFAPALSITLAVGYAIWGWLLSLEIARFSIHITLAATQVFA